MPRRCCGTSPASIPFAPDNCPLGVGRDARDRRSRAPRRADRSRHCRAGARRKRRSARLYPRRPTAARWSAARIMRLVVATMLNARTVGRAAASADRASAWAPDNKHAADLIRRALVLLADHELNASTFTVRCAASTGLNLYDCVIAGLAALKGPKHGGAGVLASQLVKTLVDRDVAPVIRERVALGERFAGLRPRRLQARRSARAVACWKRWRAPARRANSPSEIPERIAEATGEFVNIDYALAVLVHTLRPAARQRTRAVCHGAQRRLDRACQRTIAARPADPAPRALCRSGAGRGPGAGR